LSAPSGILGGETAWRPAATLAAVAGAVLLGAAFSFQPVLPALILAAGLYVVLCFVSPPWALALYAFVQLAVPLYVRPPPIGPLPPPPVALTMLLTLLGCLILKAMAAPHPASRPGLLDRPALRPFLAFAFVAALSLIDPGTGSEGINMWLKAFAFPLATFVAITVIVRERADVERVLAALLAAAVAISLYAIYEFRVGENWLLQNILIPQGKEDWSTFYFTGDQLGADIAYRSFSVFSQPIEFATCVGMVYPYAVVRFGTAPGWRRRLVYGAAAAICLVGLATSFSRTATGAALLATVIAGLTVPALRRWLATGAIGLALGGLLAWPWLGARVSERLNDMDNVTLRQKLWETAASLFRDHPLLGVGFGNFPEYYLDAMRAHRIGPVNEFGADAVERIRVAESFYLQLAAETGIVGIVAFAVFLVALARVMLRVARAPYPDTSALGVSVLLGTLVYLLNAATVTAYTHFSSTLLLFGFLFPLAIILDRPRQPSVERGADRAEYPR